MYLSRPCFPCVEVALLREWQCSVSRDAGAAAVRVARGTWPWNVECMQARLLFNCHDFQAGSPPRLYKSIRSSQARRVDLLKAFQGWWPVSAKVYRTGRGKEAGPGTGPVSKRGRTAVGEVPPQAKLHRQEPSSALREQWQTNEEQI